MNDFSPALEPLAELDAEPIPGEQCAMHARRVHTVARRAFGEEKLLAIMADSPLEHGYAYHFLTGGDIDALTFLKIILSRQPLDYCLLSTWCMALDDVQQFALWLASGRIRRLDAYVGEIFPRSYQPQYNLLCQVVRPAGGRVCVFRNHAKIFAGVGPDFSFAVESSANINTNPRTENTVVSVGPEIFVFYKDYFDGIHNFCRNFDSWQPWPFALEASRP